MTEIDVPREPRGLRAIAGAFQRAHAEGHRVLIPYLTAGYPSREASVRCIEACIAAGADILEIGVPFSDPIADGRVIQAASDAALKQGMTLRRVLDLVRDLRMRHATPILLMTYLNPIRAMGESAALDAFVEAGVDGLIVPDLVPDEGESLRVAAAARGVALVFLASSNAKDERLKLVAGATSGFLYALGLEGVTGEREQVAPGLEKFLARLRVAVAAARPDGDLPIAIGFGVSKPEHAAALGRLADGVIVGSAVVRRMAEGPDAVGNFVRSLKEAS